MTPALLHSSSASPGVEDVAQLGAEPAEVWLNVPLGLELFRSRGAWAPCSSTQRISLALQRTERASRSLASRHRLEDARCRCLQVLHQLDERLSITLQLRHYGFLLLWPGVHLLHGLRHGSGCKQHVTLLPVFPANRVQHNLKQRLPVFVVDLSRRGRGVTARKMCLEGSNYHDVASFESLPLSSSSPSSSTTSVATDMQTDSSQNKQSTTAKTLFESRNL